MEELNYDYDLKLERWDNVLQGIENKDIDVVIGLIYSQERAKIVRFSLPTCVINRNFITRKKDKYRSFDDLKGKEIMVERNGWSHKYLLNNNLTDHIITTDNIDESLQLLNEGKHDAILTSDLVSAYAMKKFGIKNLVIGDMGIDPQNYSIGVNQDKD